jgi:hypothetical protein
MEFCMFAALFTRPQEIAHAAVAAKADRAAFDRWTDEDAADQDHSLPVPWDWWTNPTAKN